MRNFLDSIIIIVFFAIVACSGITMIFPLKMVFADEDQQPSSKALFDKAMIAITNSKYEEAIQSFDKILELDPQNHAVLSNKGAALLKLQRNEEAIQSFDKILELDPNNIAALSNKGVALVNLGRYEQAIENFDKVLAIEPEHENTLKNRVTAFSVIREVPVADSEYLIHVQIQVRNSQGMLVSFTESDVIWFLPHPLTEEFLDTIPVNEIVLKNNKEYEKRQVITALYANQDTFISSTSLVSEKFGQPVGVIFSMHHSYTIDDGDVAIASWTILRSIN